MGVRAGVIDLNVCPWRIGLRKLCTLSNEGEREDVRRFLGVCSVLGKMRIRHFGVNVLLNDEWFAGGRLVGFLRNA